jgi:predicted DNA-binding transcriptional regulator AlpA
MSKEVLAMHTNPKTGLLEALLTPPQAAAFLGVSLSWLAKARVAGNGPRFVKIGRAVRYVDSAVRDYIRARTRGSTSEA